MSWKQVNWATLERLRGNFLSEEPSSHGDYWKTNEDLESYDLTFACRIGWKWDAVLTESHERGWTPPPDAVLLDWGCGTGIAARRMLSSFGAGLFPSVLLMGSLTPRPKFRRREGQGRGAADPRRRMGWKTNLRRKNRHCS